MANVVIWGLFFAMVFGTLGYALGKKLKGNGEFGAIAGALLGPLGLLAIFVVPDKRPQCRECKSIVAEGATRCAKCRAEVPPQVVAREHTPPIVYVVAAIFVVMIIVAVQLFG